MGAAVRDGARLSERRGYHHRPEHPVELPAPLPFRESPNQSPRQHGITPYLIVVHRPVGAYGPSIEWLCNPRSQVSAHVITEGNGTGVDVATQLVPWERKAWACASFNSVSYNVEVDDDAWNGLDPGAFATAARICGFICAKTGIPAVWSRDATRKPGLVRHLDLGRAGGGHSDPTDDVALWRSFVRQTAVELERGGFRLRWGRGRFARV